MDTIHSDIFPDGTPVDGWFHNTSIPELTKLGKQYIITDYGIHDDGRIYTDNFQKLIDLVYWWRCNRYSAWYIHDWSFIFQTGS